MYYQENIQLKTVQAKPNTNRIQLKRIDCQWKELSQKYFISNTARERALTENFFGRGEEDTVRETI